MDSWCCLPPNFGEQNAASATFNPAFEFPFLLPRHSFVSFLVGSATKMELDAAGFEALGRALAGFKASQCYNTRRRRFVSFFGVEASLVSCLWLMLIQHGRLANLRSPKHIHLLWALCSCKSMTRKRGMQPAANVMKRHFGSGHGGMQRQSQTWMNMLWVSQEFVEVLAQLPLN